MEMEWEMEMEMEMEIRYKKERSGLESRKVRLWFVVR